MRAVDDASCAPQGDQSCIVKCLAATAKYQRGFFSLEDKHALIVCWFRQIENAIVFFTNLYESC
jgi:hypothetical protein